MAADDGRAALLQQCGQVLRQADRGEEIAFAQAFAAGQAVCLHGPEKRLVALLVNVGPQRVAQVADLLVAQAFQVADGLVHGLGIVHADAGDPGVPRHTVVVKHGRGLAGLEVLQPGVVERKAQKQAAEVVVLHHVGVVGDAVFQCTAQRHDHHLAAVRLGQLPEPRQDVVAEVLRLCVIHVGDENCDAARCVLPADAGIAQLHGGLDHRFAHGIADAACTAQRLGNSTF